MTTRPSFLIIGAQKCGTTWLWEMLRQHSGADLRVKKDIHFFSLSHVYKNGLDWYFSRFDHLDNTKVIGDVSADYFYDHVLIDNVNVDTDLPVIPELVTRAIPGVKIIVILRDPVKRAISAYYHHMRRRRYSPFLGLREAVEQNPHLRIVERGHYARFIKVWKKYVHAERMLCFIYEEDVTASPGETTKKAYQFLGLDTRFEAKNPDTPRNRGWGLLSLLLNYYSKGFYGNLYKLMLKTQGALTFSKFGPSYRSKIGIEDIEYLRAAYVREKGEIENLLSRRLDGWTYGAEDACESRS